MALPAVAEQQAKLGVSAEESKAQRLKRQQARFRDRGGVFVPSTSNPLVDILLARTVSGESPSKACPRDVAGKRLSPSKARQASPTRKANATAVAGSSKPKLPASRKGKATALKPKDDEIAQPPPKRRGTAKGKKRTPGPDSDTGQPLPATTKPKRTLKGKDKQRAAPSIPDGDPTTKTKAKAKSKQVVEVLVSDDDQTLVEVPHRVKSNSKRNMPNRDDGETDDDAPIVRKRAKLRADDSKAKTITHTKAEKKQTLEDAGERTQDEKCHKTVTKKHLVSCDDEDDDDVAPPARKGRVANSTSAKPESTPELEPIPRPAKATKSGRKLKAADNGKGKGNAEPAQSVAETVGGREDERPLERVPKSQKRKKEEDNYDDRPRKVVKFTEIGPPHSSSQKLKENQSDRKRNVGAKSRVKEPDALPSKPVAKPPSRAKTPKGPPREVLERIKASAARHSRCVDSEPDELDCLS